MNVRTSLFFSLLERYTGFAIHFISNLILARLLTPAEIGVYSVSSALLALFYVVREFGITTFLIQERALTDAKIRTAFGLMILMSWPMAGVAWLGRDFVASFYNSPEIAPLIAVMAINFVILPFGQPARGLLNRAMRFKALTLIDIASAGTHAVAAISFAWDGHGPMSLAYASVIGTAAAIALTLCFEPRHIRLRPGLKHWREMLAFGGFSTGASLVNSVGANTAEIVIGKALDLASVGLYSRAVGLVSLLQSQLPSAFARVALPGFAEMVRQGRQLEQTYLTALGHLTGFLWPAYVCLALISEPLIGLLFGDQWLGAAPVAQILCIGGLLNTVIFLVHSVYGAQGVMRRRFGAESAAQLLRIVLTVIAAPFGLNAVATAQVAFSVGSGLIYYRVIRKYLRISFRNLLEASWRSAVVSAIAVLSILAGWMLSGVSEDNHLGRVGIAAVSGTLGWWIGIDLTRHALGHEIKQLADMMFRQVFTRSSS